MKIVFTGSQGTGKTTVLEHFGSKGYVTITEVVRNLAKKGYKINEGGDAESQMAIINEYLDLFSKNESFISDRGLTDVAAYAVWLYQQGRISREEMETFTDVWFAGLADNKDVMYCYFPIEFDVEDDGVRSTDNDFRKGIDHNIQILLKELHIPFVTIHGTVEERIALVENLIEVLDPKK